MNATILVWLVDQLFTLLEPLEDALDTEKKFAAFLLRFGWVVDPTTFRITDIQNSLGINQELAQAATDFSVAISAPPGGPNIGTLLNLTRALTQIVDAVRRLDPTQPPVNISRSLWSDVAPKIAEDLLAQYLE